MCVNFSVVIRLKLIVKLKYELKILKYTNYDTNYCIITGYVCNPSTKITRIGQSKKIYEEIKNTRNNYMLYLKVRSGYEGHLFLYN